MRIDQATYGLASNGHSLLQNSGSRELAKELERRMDLPNTAPHGIAWSPYVSGFPWKDHYVLSMTVLDTSAMRGGVVFTRAIFLPIEEIVLAKNIRPLLQYLAKTLDAGDKDVSTLEIPASDTSGHSPSPAPISAINALFSREGGPAVWIGTDGFDEVVIAVWAILWPELRRSFGFRLSFGPDDVVEVPKPNLVVTPEGLEARWAHHKIIERSRTAQQPSQLTAALLHAETDQRLRHLVEEFGLRVGGLQALALIDQLYRLLGRDDFEALLSALRVIESLSTSAEVGREAKEELLRRVSAKVYGIEASQILLLRNLELTKIEKSGALWSELRHRIASADFEPSDDQAYLQVARDALVGSVSVKWWSDAVKSGIIDATSKPAKRFPAACWRWLISNTETGIAVLSLIPAGDEFEAALTDSIPRKLPETVGLKLLSVCKQKGLLRLHGVVLNRTFDLQEAIKRQLAIDTDPAFLGGIALAVGDAPSEDVIHAAQTAGDARLISMAAKRVVAMPTALGDADFTLPIVQTIWALALSRSPNTWKAPRNPQRAAAIVLDCLIDDRPIASSIVDQIARTPLADVSRFQRRSLVWEKLTGASTQSFLSATARGFIDGLMQAETPRTPEPILAAAVLNEEHTYDALATLMQERVSHAINIISAFPSFSEQHAERLLTRLMSTVHQIPVPTSWALGTWIKQRGWRATADWILHRMLNGRADLRPALTQCAEFFSWMTRLRYHLSSVSSDEKWAALRELASTLYSSGPDHHEIWERSGGKNKDLEYQGDGHTRWTVALKRVRNGNGVHLARLIDEMRRDYPVNDELRILSEDREFGARQK